MYDSSTMVLLESINLQLNAIYFTTEFPATKYFKIIFQIFLIITAFKIFI